MGKWREEYIPEEQQEGCPDAYKCGRDDYRNCKNPMRFNPDYCDVLQDWPELLKPP
jgi:hypothetical protein